jgi:hypothetical protein
MITRANLESEDEEKMKNEKIVARSFLKKT